MKEPIRDKYGNTVDENNTIAVAYRDGNGSEIALGIVSYIDWERGWLHFMEFPIDEPRPRKIQLCNVPERVARAR
jgi:hypothetical protein